MTQNLDNALHGIQEVRTAIFLETGEAETLEQEDALEAMQKLINEVESMVKAYDG